MNYDRFEVAKSLIEEVLQEAMEENDDVASVWRAMKEVLDNNEEELVAACVVEGDDES